jgi:hypothetical protein
LKPAKKGVATHEKSRASIRKKNKLVFHQRQACFLKRQAREFKKQGIVLRILHHDAPGGQSGGF